MDKKIRAKMVCESAVLEGANENVSMHAVYDDSEENKVWSKYTPAGSVLLTISNPEAQGAFVPGKEYYVDFTPAD